MPFDELLYPAIIMITAPKVSAMKNTSAPLSFYFKKHIARRQTNTGMVLFISATITTSICSTATMLIRLLIVDWNDLKIRGARYFLSMLV